MSGLAANLRVVRALGMCSIRQTFRRPQLMAPIVVFPTILLAIGPAAPARPSTCPVSHRCRASSSSCSPGR